MTRADAERQIEEHIEHALREIEQARWKMEDLGYDPAIQKRTDTVMRKLIGLTWDLAH